MGESSDPALLALLGRSGVSALGRARGALADCRVDIAGVMLRVAAWTAPEWSFRFDVADSGRVLVVCVPHDGGPATITDAGRHPNPFIPGGG